MKNNVTLILLSIFFLASCHQKPELRVYEEVDVEPPVVQKFPNNKLPEGHPELPEGHPSLSAGQPELPEGHPPIDGGMGMGMSNMDPQMQAMIQSSRSSVPLTWKAPQPWSEEKGSGMRLVTFKSTDADPITCTIVSLGGMAGGLDSNILRWAKQINISEDKLSGEKLQKFIKSQETVKSSGNLNVRLIDLTTLSDSQNKSVQSLLGGVVETKDTTIFIKMTGSLSAIQQNREAFKALCLSLSLNP